MVSCAAGSGVYPLDAHPRLRPLSPWSASCRCDRSARAVRQSLPDTTTASPDCHQASGAAARTPCRLLQLAVQHCGSSLATPSDRSTRERHSRDADVRRLVPTDSPAVRPAPSRRRPRPVPESEERHVMAVALAGPAAELRRWQAGRFARIPYPKTLDRETFPETWADTAFLLSSAAPTP